MRRRNRGDEELASVRSRSRIRHTQEKRLFMNLLEVLVLKFLAIYALSTCAIVLCEVAALDHEGFYDAVENGALVVEQLSGLAHTLFTCA